MLDGPAYRADKPARPFVWHGEPRLSSIFDMRDPAVRQARIGAAAEALARGALVGMPTETVYGLAADASHTDAIAADFAAHGRPRRGPDDPRRRVDHRRCEPRRADAPAAGGDRPRADRRPVGRAARVRAGWRVPPARSRHARVALRAESKAPPKCRTGAAWGGVA